MKKTSVFLTILLVVSLIFAVSCPGETPSAKITSPVGDDAKITVIIGEQDKSQEVVIELANDTFNEEAFDVTAGNETALSSWFTSSDATKATVSAKIKTNGLEEAATTKADEAKKYVKATVVLSVHPLVATAENTPVKVAFKIPAVTGEAKKWTTSGKELTAENAIEITVEEKKEPSLTLTSPTGAQVWKLFVANIDSKTYDLELELKNAKFNTTKVTTGASVSKWFSVVDKVINSDNFPKFEATIKEGSTENLAKISLQVTSSWGGPRIGVKLVISIPAEEEEEEKWTDANVELEAENNITINLVQESPGVLNSLLNISYSVGDTDEKTATLRTEGSHIKFNPDFDFSSLVISKNDSYTENNIKVTSVSYKSEKELNVTVKPTSSVTAADACDKAFSFELPEDAFVYDDYSMFQNLVKCEITISVS